nr:uncharacterized protein LOC123766877 [Procambarus clarkii]
MRGEVRGIRHLLHQFCYTSADHSPVMTPNKYPILSKLRQLRPRMKLVLFIILAVVVVMVATILFYVKILSTNGIGNPATNESRACKDVGCSDGSECLLHKPTQATEDAFLEDAKQDLGKNEPEYLNKLNFRGPLPKVMRCLTPLEGCKYPFKYNRAATYVNTTASVDVEYLGKMYKLNIGYMEDQCCYCTTERAGVEDNSRPAGHFPQIHSVYLSNLP